MVIILFKIIELRKASQESDEARCHFELQASEHEKQLEDANYFISVMEERRQYEIIEMQRRHEEEIQFLLAQLLSCELKMDNQYTYQTPFLKNLDFLSEMLFLSS